MAKLHNYELDWHQIVKESIIWLVVFFAYVYWQTSDWPFIAECRDDTLKNFWSKNLLPQPNNGGWGPLSFITAVTGLNIAIVKLQSFLKAQREAQEKWVSEGIQRAFKDHPDLLVDDEIKEDFQAAVVEHSKMLVDNINAERMSSWVMWSRWAFRMTVLGFLCLVFGYSAGILVIFMLIPVLGTMGLGRTSAEALFNKIDAVCGIAAEYVLRLKKKSKANEKGVVQELQRATTLSEEAPKTSSLVAGDS